jgi:hypothetical protein
VRVIRVVAGIPPTFVGLGTSATVQGGVFHPLTPFAMVGGSTQF